MKYFITLITLLTLHSFCLAQTDQEVKLIGVRDTSKYDLKPGFYMAFPVDARSQGFKYSNRFYFIDPDNRLSLTNLDSIYHSYEALTGAPAINFNFNAEGEKELKKFTTENAGYEIALLINNKLFAVALVKRPITSGLLTIEQMAEAQTREIKKLLTK